MTSHPLTRPQAQALLLCMADPVAKYGYNGAALRVSTTGDARWESTTGSAALIVYAGRSELAPGVYRATTADITRCARIAPYMRRDSDDVVPVTPDVEGPKAWPDFTLIDPLTTKQPSYGDPLAPIGLAPGLLLAAAKVGRLLGVGGWQMHRQGPLDTVALDAPGVARCLVSPRRTD